MAQLARGAVSDRPWGRTLGALGLRGLTGQLTLRADGKAYQVVFTDGAVVGATSPQASDAAVRIALTGGLLSSTQVADVARRQAASPGRDEIEVIAELVRLGPEQALRLRRRTIAQRAARTFSVERGDFVVDDQITIPIVGGTALDIRAVIFLGARHNLSEVRLASELGQLGQSFRLKAGAVDDLPQFGFTDAERPVLDRLLQGASLGELEATGIESRVVRSMVYALVSCGACDVEAQVRVPPQAKPSARARATSREDVAVDAATRKRRASSQAEDGDGAANRPGSEPGRRRLPTSRPPATRRKSTDTGQAANVRALIAQRVEQLKKNVDHYTLLAVPQEASAEDIRKAYFALARQLHPDRLSALGITDDAREAQHLFAQVNSAFAVLSDQMRRREYTQILRRGGEAAVRADQARAEAMAERIVESEEAFRRGEMALRRDQHGTAIAELERAIQLNPEEADYHATLAWAKFVSSADKMSVAAATRTALERAIAKSPKAITARFYLGRVERMLGRDQDALRHFQDVLKLSPHHAEAASEARVIEARLANKDDKGGGGLFGRSKR